MQASKLYPGEFYAWHSNPPKGATPINALKVRLVETRQRKSTWDTNRHTVAHIVVVETGKEREVRARELISFWDEYEIEQAHMLKERAEREKKLKRERLRSQVTQDIINSKVGFKDLPLTFHLGYGNEVRVDLAQIKEWLHISEIDIERELDKAMEEDG